MLDDRAKLLLKALVERYIADGQPVGSRTLAKAAGLDLSPATIRNVMSDLEELGLIASPHTSAGRIPTARGYRLFVDTMLTVRRDGLPGVGEMGAPGIEAGQPQRVISHAAQMLSSLSHFVGVEMATLMQAAVEIGADDNAGQEAVVVSGERNLLSVSEFSSDMGNLRRLFDLFEQKTQLIRLLDVSAQADGVRIYIGGESQVVPFEDLSVVTAPYEVDGQVVGTLGVIGPQRMSYERMIQIVDVTAKLVSNALSHSK